MAVNSVRIINNVTDLNEVRQTRARSNSVTPETPKANVTPLKSNNGHGNRRFDQAKVDRIKAEIAAGEYVIDPQRVADKFIEHERNQ